MLRIISQVSSMARGGRIVGPAKFNYRFIYFFPQQRYHFNWELLALAELVSCRAQEK